jgi:hypothetical protein
VLIMCKSQCLPALFFFKCCAIVDDTQDSLRICRLRERMVVFSIPTPCRPADRLPSTDVPRLGTPNWTIVTWGETGREGGAAGKNSIVLIAFPSRVGAAVHFGHSPGGSIARDAIFYPLNIPGPWVIELEKLEDDRGFFARRSAAICSWSDGFAHITAVERLVRPPTRCAASTSRLPRMKRSSSPVAPEG